MGKQRALAHIEKIEWVKPINGADNIELIGVLGWQCIAKKDEFKQGDLCVYIEIDSKVPEREEFEFLRQRHFKVKTLKFNKFKDEYGVGVISQGLALPYCLFSDLYKKDCITPKFNVGDDVTNALGITYYNPEDLKRKTNVVPDKYKAMMQRRRDIFSKTYIKKMMRYEWFRKVMFLLFGRKKDKPLKFPSWIAKTDEERIENLPQYLNDHNTTWLMTEKIDGTSTTFALDKKRFGKWDFIVCSRNVRQQTPDQVCFYDDNVYWEIAKRYDIENVLHSIIRSLKDKDDMDVQRIVLQGETYGTKICGNNYNMDDIDFLAFNLIVTYYQYGDSNKMYMSTYEIADQLKPYGIKSVPILGTYQFPEGITMHDFKLEADGESVIANVSREGIVYRNINDARQSFKNVSNAYLLKKKE